MRFNCRFTGPLCVALALAGCQEEAVQHYRVPKPPPPGGVRYDVPAGWIKSPQLAPMSVASFQIVEGDRKAEVTITPLAGPAGGLLSNINRWRVNQLGLKELTEEELPTQTTKRTVAGSEAIAADFTGAESEESKRQRIVGVIWPHGGKTWFIKLRGPADLVAKQQTAWDTFIKSIRVEGE